MKFLTKTNSSKDLSIILKLLFIVTSIVFIIPSVSFFINSGSLLNFNLEFKFFLTPDNTSTQAITYIAITLALICLYLLILKYRSTVFKNIRSIFLFIIIISFIFSICVPFLSTDIFYYLGTGRIDATYNQNPYYTSIQDFVGSDDNMAYIENGDEVLESGFNNYWSNTTVVYGPVWNFICKFIAAISFGDINFAVYAFKLLSLFAHILSCYFIYKITKKKFFVLLYGLNPLILIYGLSDCHNDMFVLLFIFASLFFLLSKKNIHLSILFLALATGIKYFAILFLPLFIIYHYRKHTPIHRLKYCILLGLEFIIILFGLYYVYIQDWQVLSGILAQQSRFSKTPYIFILNFFPNAHDLISSLRYVFSIVFVIIYTSICIRLLIKTKISFVKEINKLYYVFLIFLFLLITNFQPWYIMWLFPLIFWQRADKMKMILRMSFVILLASSIFIYINESYLLAMPYTFFILASIMLCLKLENKNLRRFKQYFDVLPKRI